MRELRLKAAVINLEIGVVMREGQVSKLSPTELKVLRYLARRSPDAVAKRELEREVWGYREGVESHTVMSTMLRLRQKIEADAKAPDHLVTERGLGYRLLLPVGAQSAPALSTAQFLTSRMPHNPPPTALLGRDPLVANALLALENTRCLTLFGPGGIGKTRIAHAILERLATDDRVVVFCDVSAASSADDLVHELAATLGVQLVAIAPQDAIAHALLGPKRVLVALDNIEQVLAPARAFIADALARVPGLTVLATTRETLASPFESVIVVPALNGRDAGTLFSGCYRRAAPDAPALTPDEVEAVVAACEGVPLALELAGARGRLMPPRELVRRFDEVLQRPGPARHSSLETNIRWSWDLLSEAARTLLLRLSWYASGFGLDAVLGVARDLVAGASSEVDLLDELVRKSLVTVDRHTSRFAVAQSVRAFARNVASVAVAGERDLTAARWLAQAALGWVGDLETGDTRAVREASDALAHEAGNLRSATLEVLAQDPSLACQLVLAQRSLWLTDGPYADALACIQAVVRETHPGEASDASRGPLEFLRGRLLLGLGRIPEALGAFLQAGGDTSAPDRVRAQAWTLLASTLGHDANAERARGEAHHLFGDTPLGQADRLAAMASAAWYRGDVEDGLALAEASLRGFEQLGVARRSIQMQIHCGRYLLDLERHGAALRYLTRAHEAALEAGLRHYSLAAKAIIAYLHHDRGSFEEARATYSAVGFESQRQGRLLLTALVRIYEASLPGERQARITLLEGTLRAIDRVDMRAIEALALATLVRLDPSRQDAAARARALLAQPNAVPSPRREAVQVLLGDALPPEVVSRAAIIRVSARVS